MSRIQRSAGVVLALALLAPPALTAQTDLLARRADAAYRAEEWQEAASAYGQLAELTGDPAAWYRLGHARLELGHAEAAVEALERALSLGFPGRFAHYLIARALARTGHEDRAVDHLGQAVADGFLDAEGMREEPDFAGMRDNPIFQAALERAADPVAFMEGGDAMDFWVGEWDVFAGDQKVGTSRIEKILGGAAILEHWTGIDGSQGKSLFYFLPDNAQWKQVWVVEGAGVSKEKLSTPVEGGLRFEGEARYQSGRRVPDRTTLTRIDAGRVRQVIEVSRDGGASWTTTFDAVYVPRAVTGP